MFQQPFFFKNLCKMNRLFSFSLKQRETFRFSGPLQAQNLIQIVMMHVAYSDKICEKNEIRMSCELKSGQTEYVNLKRSTRQAIVRSKVKGNVKDKRNS